MSQPPPTPKVQPQAARAGYAAPGVPCPICRQPLPAGRRVCSGRCRAALSRTRRAEAQAARDAEVRRLLAAALRLLDGGML
jgi:predicted nucleic acid-binding Zn ribbon protein